MTTHDESGEVWMDLPDGAQPYSDPATWEHVIREGVVVHPGDTLLVRAAPDTPLDQVHAMREALVDRLPDVKVLVVACEQLAAVRGEQR